MSPTQSTYGEKYVRGQMYAKKQTHHGSIALGGVTDGDDDIVGAMETVEASRKELEIPSETILELTDAEDDDPHTLPHPVLHFP